MEFFQPAAFINSKGFMLLVKKIWVAFLLNVMMLL